MATSGALNTSNQYVKYKITVTQNSQSVENNTSNVTVSVKFYRTNSGYTTYGTGTVYCRINGTLYSAAVTTSQKITNSGIVLFTKTLNIAHNNDGTKTLSVSAWISHNAPLTSNEQSYSQTLTTIPRASQPSCVTYPNHTQDVGNFGDTISIHMNSKSSAFDHYVYYSFGSISWELIASKVKNGTTWEIPPELMDQIPNATSGSGTIWVETYNGTTFIGRKSCGFTATVPILVKPSCSIQVLDATDTKDTYGNLVKGLSKLYVKVTGKSAYSSPILSYETSVFIGDSVKSYNGNEITTDILSGNGETVVVWSRVTDNRKRLSEYTEAVFPVLSYEKPKITALSVHRCDEDGNEDENGEFAEVKFSASITPLNNKNSAAYTLEYTNNTTGEVKSVPLTDIAGDYTVTDYTKVVAADSGSSYTVQIIAEDDIASVPLGTSVSTAFTLYNCHNSGTGWAFGKVSEEENTLENALEFRQLANSFAYQPSAFSGEKGYTLLAQISLNTLNVNAPIVFEINRRGALCPMTVYVRFASSSTTTDPALGSITYDGDNYGAFLVKASTSTWKLYVDNTTGWSNPCLQKWYTTDNQNARLTVDFPSEQITELPTPYYRATPAKMQSILDFIYPVGSIYLSYSHNDPATLFGGTWVRLQNAFLWATDENGTIGATGGEKTHTLTVSEIPKHTHGISWTDADGNAYGGSTQTNPLVRYGTSGVGFDGVNTLGSGGGAAHNNMPPYIQVSAWRRTA